MVSAAPPPERRNVGDCTMKGCQTTGFSHPFRCQSDAVQTQRMGKRRAVAGSVGSQTSVLRFAPQNAPIWQTDSDAPEQRILDCDLG